MSERSRVQIHLKDLAPPLVQNIHNKIQQISSKLERFGHLPLEFHWELHQQKTDWRASCHLSGKHLHLQSEGIHEDPELCLEQAAKKMERQLKKEKREH